MIDERENTTGAFTCSAFGFYAARIQTFFNGAFRTALPPFLYGITAAEFWTLDQCTSDFPIIALAFWRTGAWRPAFSMLMQNTVIVTICFS